MTTPNYNHSLSLSAKEEQYVVRLKEKGVGITEIFRQGLQFCMDAEFNETIKS